MIVPFRKKSFLYSSGSASSGVRILKSTTTNTNEKSPSSPSRKSITGLLKRTPTTSTSSSPVQSRIANKATSTSKLKKKGSTASLGGGQPQKEQAQPQTSDHKRAQFTQVRSKTGLNIFGGRRRSIAITDDAYNAAMRAAKSHLDLRDSVEQPQEHAASATASNAPASAIANDKTRLKALGKNTASQLSVPDVTTEIPVKKHFGERPWIELEKLWRGRLKNPPPDLTEDFLTVTSSKNQKAQTLPVNSRPPPYGKKHSSNEQWPPSASPAAPPRRTISNAGTHSGGISREAAQKAIYLTSGEVLVDWRQQVNSSSNLNRPHSFALTTEVDNHFEELVNIW